MATCKSASKSYKLCPSSCDRTICARTKEDAGNHHSHVEFKWFWMMDYCKRNAIPPGESWAWEKAEQSFIYNHGEDK